MKFKLLFKRKKITERYLANQKNNIERDPSRLVHKRTTTRDSNRDIVNKLLQPFGKDQLINILEAA